MINTDHLRNLISDLFSAGNDEKLVPVDPEGLKTLASPIEQAADELDAARASNLVKYRQAAMGQVSWAYGKAESGERQLDKAARFAEQIAHAMLAAERVPGSLNVAPAFPPSSAAPKTPQAIVNDWNARVPIGTRVKFNFTPAEADSPTEGVTASTAFLIGYGQTPAVLLDGSQSNVGPWPLHRLQVIDDAGGRASPSPP